MGDIVPNNIHFHLYNVPLDIIKNPGIFGLKEKLPVKKY